MAGHLELTAADLAVEMGDVAEVVVRVSNDADAIEAFELGVTGEAASWARVEPNVLAIPANTTVDVLIRFDIPESALGAGEVHYRVRLSWAASLHGASVDGVLNIGGQAHIVAGLRPDVARGARRATAYVQMQNTGSAPMRVSIGGASDEVAVEPERESVVVDAGQSETVRLRLHPRQPPAAFRRRHHPYGVVVEPLKGEAITLEGELRQRAAAVALVPLAVLAILATGITAAFLLGRDGTDGATTVGAGTTTTARAATTSAPSTTAAATTTSVPAVADDTIPPVPPEQRRIAFQSARDTNFEIYTADANGGDLRNVTNHPAHDSEPAWSPDGHRMAFDSDRDEGPGQFEIYVMNGDGTNITRVTNSPGPDGYPTWSPDGTRIAFISFRDGNSEIYVIAADGTGEARRLTRHPSDDVHPEWSPDGQTILFASNRTGDYEVWRMRASDGGELSRLTDSPGADMNPAWSPDGGRIAFDSSRDGDKEIYVMNADGGEPVRITEAPGPDVWPAWSSDGATLVFASAREGDEELYAVDLGATGAATGPPRRLTTSTGTDSEPDW
jgi:Tol biopolymer transport system component